MAFSPRPLHPPGLHTHLSKLRKALTCSICHQLFQKPACLYCNHHFCMSCLLKSMEQMSACPKCKQPATTRQARFAPEMDNLVDIFQSLESPARPIIAKSEDSQLENLPVTKNVAFNVKVEDECLSPSALKRQRRQENRERVSSISTRSMDADSRKRDASLMELPCRGVLPAPKRIQLSSPPLPTDEREVPDANLEKKEMTLATHQTLGPVNANISPNALLKQQKLERNGTHADTALHVTHKQDVERRAGGAHEQLADGSVRPNTMLPNRPDVGAEKVPCAFCHISDSEVAGPIIHYKKGVPVSASKRSGQIFSVHKNCAEWAPGVYYENDVAKNIPEEIARGSKMKCHVCGLKGAVLGCYVKRCRKSFHYPCTYTLPCRWDDSNFLVFCPEHVASRFPDEGPTASSSKSTSLLNSGHKEERPKKQASFAHGNDHQSNMGVDGATSVDAYISRLPAQAEACNEEPSQQWPSSKWVLCGSALSPRANELLSAFVSLTGLTVEKSWSSSVTHLIIGTDEIGAARRTFKYLMANLEGKWILKIDWLSACMAANDYVNEEPYEVNLDIHGMIGGPRRARGMAIAKANKLFEGYRFYFMGEYTTAYKADLEALLTTGGGETLGQLPESDETACIVIIYSKDMHSDASASDREERNKNRYLEAKSLAGITGAKVAGHTWILDSVAACELQPFE